MTSQVRTQAKQLATLPQLPIVPHLQTSLERSEQRHVREVAARITIIYMSAKVQTIDAGADIVEVADLFLKSRYRRFPVTMNDRLVGLISRYDVLRALEDLW